MTKNADSIEDFAPLSPESVRFVADHRTDDVDRLALSLAGRTDIDVPAVLRQIEGWQRLRSKVPAWASVADLRYPPRLSLEQCSGETAARYKDSLSRRLLPKGAKMADLTGGFGVDFAFLAARFSEKIYVERNPELCLLAKHNFPRLGLPDVRVVEADATDHLAAMAPVDLIFLDPARRDGAGRKMVGLEDCTPNVVELRPRLLEKARLVMVKLSPMLDLSSALQSLPETVEAHVVSVGGECKELLFALRRDSRGEPLVCCGGDIAPFTFRPEEERNAVPTYADELRTYLYEPDAALLKAGAFRLPAVRFSLDKLHPNSHLYTSDRLVADFPGRVFKIESEAGFSKRELRALAADCPKMNLAVRNFPATTAELRKRTGLKDGGDRYGFATTLATGRKLIAVCRKV